MRLYRYEMRLVARRLARTLLGLRVATVAAVFLTLCFEPTLRTTASHEVPSRLLIAIDKSDSMRVTDPHRPDPEKRERSRTLGQVATSWFYPPRPQVMTRRGEGCSRARLRWRMTRKCDPVDIFKFLPRRKTLGDPSKFQSPETSSSRHLCHLSRHRGRSRWDHPMALGGRRRTGGKP